MSKPSPDEKPTTLIRQLTDTLVVAVYGESSPTDADWERYMAVVKGLTKPYRMVIFSAGGGPTTMQRRDVEEVTNGQQSRVAVVTTSRVARGIVTAIAWFNRDIKAFEPTKHVEAFTYLGLDDAERTKVLVAAKEMATELGVPPSLVLGT